MGESKYQHMYAILCEAASDSIDLLAAGQADAAAEQLKTALEEAEECYISAE